MYTQEAKFGPACMLLHVVGTSGKVGVVDRDGVEVELSGQSRNRYQVSRSQYGA